MDFESVLAKTDLYELVAQAGGDLDGHGRGACPLHGGEDKNAFHVFTDAGKQKYKCFSGDCGTGDAIDFVRAWRGWTIAQAYEFLGGARQYDPQEMKRLADQRHERAARELAEKQARMDAARKELQAAERHLLYHDQMQQWARDQWTARGLDEGLQDFFTLGACDAFDMGGYSTPTLTIPIFGTERELLNIKHRLIKPINPKDKYRPERAGLGAFPPLLAVPTMGYDGEIIVIVEGEIKAMVTWARLEIPFVQVIGVAGKSNFDKLPEMESKNIVIIPDPDGRAEADKYAIRTGARVLYTPAKIDDYILETGMTPANLYSLLRQARRINK